MERGLRGGRDLSESIDRCYTLQSQKLLMEDVGRDQRHTTAVVSLAGGGGRLRQHSPRKRRVKSEISPTKRTASTTANATGVAEEAAGAAADDDDVTMRKRRMRDDEDGNDAVAGIGRAGRRSNGHKKIRSDTLRDVMFEVSVGACITNIESAS